MRSVDRRPTIRCIPEPSITATSPVANHPSRSTIRRSPGRFRYRVPTIGPAPAADPRRIHRRAERRIPLPATAFRHRSAATPPSRAVVHRRAGADGDECFGHTVAFDYLVSGQRPDSVEGGYRKRRAPEISNRDDDNACAAAVSAATRDHTVGTPKNIVAPKAAAPAYREGVGNRCGSPSCPGAAAPGSRGSARAHGTTEDLVPEHHR